MKFNTPLILGKIIKRYKRFFADIELFTGEIITAHTPNTGPMTSCWEPGWPVLLSKSENEKRKLPFTLEMIHNQKTWIGVNTLLSNKIVEEALRERQVEELKFFNNIKREVKFGSSRLDFFLTQAHQDQSQTCFLEVKNVTLGDSQGNCYFPDTVTERGTKHLHELIQIREKGHRAVIFFLVQREDVEVFYPASHLDPVYAETLREAQKKGVEILIYQCALTPQDITLKGKLPLRLFL